MSEDKDRKEALASAKSSLATARISLSELERLRAATRGPLPTLAVLTALLGQRIDSDATVAATGTFGLRKKALPGGGFDVAGRTAGIRLALDADSRITSITLYGDGDGSISAWHGPVAEGLNLTSTPTEVRRALGRPTATVDVNGATEERYLNNGVITAIVYGSESIGQVRLRRGTT